MTGQVNSHAGKLPTPDMLIDVPKLIAAYFSAIPDPKIPKQRVLFGTSGHRGSSLTVTFNEWHILAISQAICLYRQQHHIDGPLFLGMDTHALSLPAFQSALAVLAANQVTVMIAENNEYTPTPVISHAILTYNRQRRDHLADGIVITPSHNPPQDGGFKYNPPSGGPANLEITTWIQNQANAFLEKHLNGVKRIDFETALKSATTHQYDFIHPYVNDLENVINMSLLQKSQIHIGVDPLGGAGVHYWQPIKERYGLNLTILNHNIVDPTFRFMTVDADGQIRMNPASPYAMVPLIAQKDRFDIAFACDTDHDRHGIVTPQAGLLIPNHYLCIAMWYLSQHRPGWPKQKAVGKTVVCTQMMDWLGKKLGINITEVPVGFKWFVDGLLNGSLQFVGEESAGAVFDRLDGTVWTTDKDGMVPGLLAAEITAKLGYDLAEVYQSFENEFGKTFYAHINASATPEQKQLLKNLNAAQISTTQLAGEKINSILTIAPGDQQPIDGLKVKSREGWFVVRPSGTEATYEIYAESYQNEKQLQLIFDEAQTIVNHVFADLKP